MNIFLYYQLISTPMSSVTQFFAHLLSSMMFLCLMSCIFSFFKVCLCMLVHTTFDLTQGFPFAWHDGDKGKPNAPLNHTLVFEILKCCLLVNLTLSPTWIVVSPVLFVLSAFLMTVFTFTLFVVGVNIFESFGLSHDLC